MICILKCLFVFNKKRVPDGKWYCPTCTKEKCFIFPRRARSKRVMKKIEPAKLTMPDNAISNKKDKAPSAHESLPDEPRPSSSHRPFIIQLKMGPNTLKLGPSNKSEEKKPVKSKSNDSAMRKKKSKEDDNKSSDMRSAGNDNKGSDKKSSRSKKSNLVYGSNWSSEEASSTLDCSGFSPRKRQKDLPESAESLNLNKKNGGFTSEKNQEV